jgi:DNA-binding NtrC family response regulator
MKKIKIHCISRDDNIVSPLFETYEICRHSNVPSLTEELKKAASQYVIADLDGLDVDAATLYKEIKRASPASKVILLSSSVTVSEAVEAAKLGVSDYLKKPVEPETLLGSVKTSFFSEENVEISRALLTDAVWLTGASPKISAMFRNIEMAMRAKHDVLFVSDRGVDVKGLVRTLVKLSLKGHKLAEIDITSYSETGNENIFWTILQKAVTESDIIYFEGMDTIDDIRQKSIVEYIKEKATKGYVRVICGVSALIDNPTFSRFTKVHVPSLKERKEDLPDLIKVYIDKYSVRHGREIKYIELSALAVMSNYSWPGNYRELEAFLENTVLNCEEDVIKMEHLPITMRQFFDGLIKHEISTMLDLKVRVEKELISLYLEKTGNPEQAASALDIPVSRVKPLTRR